MMDEIEMDRQKALQGWDRQSCAEWEAYLDEIHTDEFVAQISGGMFESVADMADQMWGIKCTCDTDRYCEAHGRRKEF